MPFHLNSVEINEVPKFLFDSHSKTYHAIQVTEPLKAAHCFIILLQLQRVTSHFDVCSPSITEYENEETPKIHLTAEEPPWDPSILTRRNSEHPLNS